MEDQEEYLKKHLKPTAYGDIVPSEAEQLRRVKKALELGLLQKIPQLPTLKYGENFDYPTHTAYKNMMPLIKRNQEELLQLGIPEDKLKPYLLKKLEESNEMANLKKVYELPQRIQPDDRTDESDYNMKLLEIGRALKIKPENLQPE